MLPISGFDEAEILCGRRLVCLRSNSLAAFILAFCPVESATGESIVTCFDVSLHFFRIPVLTADGAKGDAGAPSAAGTVVAERAACMATHTFVSNGKK